MPRFPCTSPSVSLIASITRPFRLSLLQEITNANPAPKYKVNMCWIYTQRGSCPRGNKCNFAHSEAELNQSKARHNNNNNNRQSMPPGVGVSQPSAGPSKDDFFMLDQFGGKKAMGHMQSVETSPMRFPGSGGGGGVVMSKGSPLPPSQSNNLLLPQPYNGDMQMMQMGPGGGGGIPPPPPPSMNHHGPHHHAVHHHPGHSPLHAPAGPYSGPPQPPTSLHPYHQNAGPGGGAVAGMPYNPMLPPTPNQLSPMDKFGFDPTKFNPNIRVSPNLGGQPGPPLPPPPPPVMSRSPRNFPNPGLPPNNKGGGGGGGFNQNHNMFMNDMMGPAGNQMVGGGAQMANNHKQGGPPNPPNMNDYGGNKGDYLSIQQQAKNSSSSYYWRKQQPNQQMPPPSSPQQNMKSPSHLGGGGGGVGVPMSKGHLLHAGGGGGNAMNKSVGGYPGNMQNASLNEIMSPRQPPKNSPTFFGKDDLPYWAMGSGGGGGAGPQGPQAPPQHPNGDTMHPREMQRNHVMSGPNGGPHNMSHLYGEAAAGPVGPPSANNNNSNSTRRMFDRSDSILAGEDAPFEGNATTSKFGPIQRKASNSLGSGDTLKGSLGGLDLRHQAWLNSSQAGLQTSPRMMPQIPIGSEKKLSPSKELGGSHQQQQHLVSGVSGTVDHVYP